MTGRMKVATNGSSAAARPHVASADPPRASSRAQPPFEYGPVAKLRWLSAVASNNPPLSRLELAVCVVLADMAKADSGISWPSFSHIAKRTGASSRGVKYAVRKLVGLGLVELVQPGNRVRSNRYRIAFRGHPGFAASFLGSEEAITTLGSESSFTTVVKGGVKGGEEQQQEVVNPVAHESIYQSERKRRIEVDRSQAEGDALTLRPGGPSLARQPDDEGLRYPEFWEALGRRVTVHEAEVLLRELEDAGESITAIVAGAERWAKYNAATGGKRAVSPAKWLEKRKWLDDWALPAKVAKGDGKTATGESETAADIEAVNMAYMAWSTARLTAEKAYNELESALHIHLRDCPTCQDAIDERDPESICFEAEALKAKSKEARSLYKIWRQNNPEPHRTLERDLRRGPEWVKKRNELKQQFGEAGIELEDHCDACSVCSWATFTHGGNADRWPLLCGEGRRLARIEDERFAEYDEWDNPFDDNDADD